MMVLWKECLVLIFTSFVSIHAFPTPLSSSPVRIVGGTQVAKNELPYQISLQKNNRHICGGSIISTTYILTAAHCVTDPNASFSIVAGEHSLSTNDGTEQRIFAIQRKIHPNYNYNTQENDIALLKLASPLVLNAAVAMIPMANVDTVASGNALVSGWGTTSEGGSGATILRKVTVPIITDEKCRLAYPGSISSSMICAGFDAGGKDSCQGDSGGPLAVGSGTSRYLAGIVSWGEGCARPGLPGVYTEVSYFRQWIDSEIN